MLTFGVNQRRSSIAAALAALLLADATSVAAEADAESSDFAVPTYVALADDADREAAADAEIDLANVVLTAARSITTVQEAPAIISVVSDEEIQDRGFENVLDVIDTVPGWASGQTWHLLFDFAIVRGTIFSPLILVDGVPMYDIQNNAISGWRTFPIETLKRVEMVTGPGGVLWGAYSLLGIASIATKDAEDIDGVETGLRLRHGDGERGDLRAYAMMGFPNILSKKIKLFLHTSFETYDGPRMVLPQIYQVNIIPQPRGPAQYGPLTASDQERSYLLNFDGKLTLGDLRLHVSFPWSEAHMGVYGVTGLVVREDLPEDTARDPDTGELICPPGPPLADPTDLCYEKARRRAAEYDWFFRYAGAEYKKRLFDNRFQLGLKGYGVYTHHIMPLETFFPGQPGLENGFKYKADFSTYRVGGAVDTQTRFSDSIALLVGGEAIYDILPDQTTVSLQGPGSQLVVQAPDDVSILPLPCPLRPNGAGGTEFIPGCPSTQMFESRRTTLTTYGDVQWKLTKEVAIDGGGRLQVAPEGLGEHNFPYDPVLLFSTAAVWNFAEDWHLKGAFAQGFRPPAFNYTSANGRSVNIGGDPNIKVERSSAVQGEINARLFRGQGALRELNIRADYSYTVLTDIVQIRNAVFQNAGERGIHSAEFLGKAYVSGGHRFELSYTWLQIASAEFGFFRAMPEHWFQAHSVFNAIDDKLLFWTRFRVVGSLEDPNQLVEYRDLAYDELGRPYNVQTGAVGPIAVASHETVLDHLPASGRLAAGIIYMPWPKLEIELAVHNALNEHSFYPEPFNNLAPTVERLPQQQVDYWLTLSTTYRY